MTPKQRRKIGFTTTTTDVYVVVDSTNANAVIQPGQPPTTASAYLVHVADFDPVTNDAATAIQAFVRQLNFPLSSKVYAVDAAIVEEYELTVNLNPMGA